MIIFSRAPPHFNEKYAGFPKGPKIFGDLLGHYCHQVEDSAEEQEVVGGHSGESTEEQEGLG